MLLSSWGCVPAAEAPGITETIITRARSIVNIFFHFTDLAFLPLMRRILICVDRVFCCGFLSQQVLVTGVLVYA